MKSTIINAMASDNDRLLIQQIRAGDARAWDHLIACYEGRLFAFVHRRVHDRDACEDIIQETFIGFLTSLPNFDEGRALQTYLFTIASHKLTDHLRKTGRHPLQHAPDEVLQLKQDENPVPSSLARGQERQVLETEAIARALGEILDEWRDQGEFVRVKVLELLFVKGAANRDVATLLNISEQQVANIRFAAVKKISEKVRAAGLPIEVFPELQELNP
jgi:RNA polymerase sigma-70 factor, ECF subfamily